MLGTGGERHGELAPGFEAKGDGGVDGFAHLELRGAGTAGDQVAEFAGRLRVKFSIQPRSSQGAGGVSSEKRPFCEGSKKVGCF
jgi:hypothetical protein